MRYVAPGNFIKIFSLCTYQGRVTVCKKSPGVSVLSDNISQCSRHLFERSPSLPLQRYHDRMNSTKNKRPLPFDPQHEATSWACARLKGFSLPIVKGFRFAKNIVNPIQIYTIVQKIEPLTWLRSSPKSRERYAIWRIMRFETWLAMPDNTLDFIRYSHRRFSTVSKNSFLVAYYCGKVERKSVLFYFVQVMPILSVFASAYVHTFSLSLFLSVTVYFSLSLSLSVLLTPTLPFPSVVFSFLCLLLLPSFSFTFSPPFVCLFNDLTYVYERKKTLDVMKIRYYCNEKYSTFTFYLCIE